MSRRPNSKRPIHVSAVARIVGCSEVTPRPFRAAAVDDAVAKARAELGKHRAKRGHDCSTIEAGYMVNCRACGESVGHDPLRPTAEEGNAPGIWPSRDEARIAAQQHEPTARHQRAAATFVAYRADQRAERKRLGDLVDQALGISDKPLP